jgi:AAA15 family ATPase/GTPase
MKIEKLSNGDKDSWNRNDDVKKNQINSFRTGSRNIIIGPPNSGKTNLLKNMLLNKTPFYEKIIICAASKETKEFDNINCELYDNIIDIPPLEELIQKDESGNIKRTIILLEDCNSLDKNEKNVLDKFLAYGCSHHSITIVILSQTPYGISPQIRRLLDCFIIFSQTENRIVNDIPIPYEHKKAIKQLICKSKFRDFIKIDLTSENKYSLNFEPIEL